MINIKSILNNEIVENILGSSLFKILNAIISMFTVPIMLNLLGVNSYGTWVTLTAFIGWISMFDFGIGYSLRNKITESVALNKTSDTQKYFIGTFQYYFFSTFIVLFLFFISLRYISVFNKNIILTLIIFTPVIFSFPLTISLFLLQGIKKFNLINGLQMLQSIFWLFFLIFVRFRVSQPDIFLIGSFFSINYFLITSILFFTSLYFLKLNMRGFFNFSTMFEIRQVIVTGLRFFLLQLSSLFIFSLGNYLTYVYLSPANASRYDTVNKLFMFLLTIFNILVGVFWSEISHYKALKDKSRLKKIFKILLKSQIFFSFLVLITFILTPFIVEKWTHGLLIVEYIEIYPFPIFLIFQTLAYCGAVFLNAFEKLKLQIVLSVVGAILIIPLVSLFFTFFSIGIGTVPFVVSIISLPGIVFFIRKSHKLISNI